MEKPLAVGVMGAGHVPHSFARQVDCAIQSDLALLQSYPEVTKQYRQCSKLRAFRRTPTPGYTLHDLTLTRLLQHNLLHIEAPKH